MALISLIAIGPKYGRRQANIERQYQARERVAEKLAAENNSADGGRIDGQESRRPFATADEQLIPLWPLGVLLGLVACFAAAMLYRGRPGSLSSIE